MNENHYSANIMIDKLRNIGFLVNFNLKGNCLTCPFGNIKSDDFIIVDVYRYPGNSDPTNETIVYAIESYSGIRGILVTDYKIFSDTTSDEILKKLSNRNTK